MPRDWDTDFETARRRTRRTPIVLLEISTGVTAQTYIRLTSNETDYTWDGKTWSARPFDGGGSFTIKQGEMGGQTIELADADGYWQTWLLSTNFRNERVTRYEIERSENDVVTGVQKDTWRIHKTAQGDRVFRLNVMMLQALLQHIRIPMQLLTKDDYPGIPDERNSY